MPLTVTPEEKEELLCTYAALVLHDENVAVTAEKIQALIKAAGGSVEPYWPKLFAGLLEGKDISDLLLGAAGVGGGAAGPAAGEAAAEEAPKEEEPEEEEEESSDADMGFSLFD
jgi:large subunit ribosomal protein LP1